MVGAVAAIGNFDGVHLGHQRLLAETRRLAEARGAPFAVVVFEPHPRRFFRPDDPPFLITTPERRKALLRAEGAAQVHALAFDAALAGMSPEAFVGEVLKGRLGLAGVVTGAEFRFGKARAGDAAALKRLAAAAGVEAVAIEPARDGPDGAKIGSSAIRDAIVAGDMKSAAAMMGRPWAVAGPVMPGDKRGRGLGFPTANMSLGDLIEPRRGVYAVRAEVEGEEFAGVANFGRRPTVGAPSPLLETHLFDFEGDLYGRTLDVRFHDFLREERRFDGLDALKARIAADAEAARALLAKTR